MKMRQIMKNAIFLFDVSVTPYTGDRKNLKENSGNFSRPLLSYIFLPQTSFIIGPPGM